MICIYIYTYIYINTELGRVDLSLALERILIVLKINMYRIIGGKAENPGRKPGEAKAENPKKMQDQNAVIEIDLSIYLFIDLSIYLYVYIYIHKRSYKSIE